MGRSSKYIFKFTLSKSLFRRFYYGVAVAVETIGSDEIYPEIEAFPAGNENECPFFHPSTFLFSITKLYETNELLANTETHGTKTAIRKSVVKMAQTFFFINRPPLNENNGTVKQVCSVKAFDFLCKPPSIKQIKTTR